MVVVNQHQHQSTPTPTPINTNTNTTNRKGEVIMLTPRTVLDIHKICDDSSVRYALSAVRFERDPETGQPLAIATDGRRMVVMGWQEPEAAAFATTATTAEVEARLPADGSLLLPAADCREAAKFKVAALQLKRRPELGCVLMCEDCEGDATTNAPRVKLISTDGQKTIVTEASQIDGRYPKWRDVFSAATVKTHHSITIDASYLAEVASVIAKHVHGDDGTTRLTLSVNSADPANNGLILSAADGEGRTAAGIVMPISCDTSPNKTESGPQWSPVKFAASDCEVAEAAVLERITKRYNLDCESYGSNRDATIWREKFEDARDRAAQFERSMQAAESAHAESMAEIANLTAKLANEAEKCELLKNHTLKMIDELRDVKLALLEAQRENERLRRESEPTNPPASEPAAELATEPASEPAAETEQPTPPAAEGAPSAISCRKSRGSSGGQQSAATTSPAGRRRQKQTQNLADLKYLLAAVYV